MTSNMMAMFPDGLLHQKRGDITFMHQVDADDMIRSSIIELPEISSLITKYTEEVIQTASMTHSGFQMNTPDQRIMEYVTIIVPGPAILVSFDKAWENVAIFQVEIGIDPDLHIQGQIPLRLKVFDSNDQLLFDSAVQTSE